MKNLSIKAGLSKIYTNHCICATVGTNLDEAGFEACHIMIVTGHKSETSIKKYTSKTPVCKKRQMFDKLSSKMQVPVKKIATQTPAATGKPIETVGELGDFDLLDVDMDDDQDLLAFVEKVEKELQPHVKVTAEISPALQKKNALQCEKQELPKNLQMQWQNFQKFTSMPAMIFPNSNVTINYNFK